MFTQYNKQLLKGEVGCFCKNVFVFKRFSLELGKLPKLHKVVVKAIGKFSNKNKDEV